MKKIKAFFLIGLLVSVLSCSEDEESKPVTSVDTTIAAPTISVVVKASDAILTQGQSVEAGKDLTMTAVVTAAAGFKSVTFVTGSFSNTKDKSDLGLDDDATTATAEWMINIVTVGDLKMDFEVEDAKGQKGTASFVLKVIEKTTEDVQLPSSINLVDIPSGTFTMGGPTKANDAPEHKVTLSAFKMSEHEITNAEYVEFLNAAFEKSWVKVEAQSTVDPCGTYTENMVVGTGDAPNAGEIFLQLGETGGCTSDGFDEHIDNKSWISFNTDSNQFELLDNTKAEWPVNWVKWYGAFAFTEFYEVSLPSEAQWEYSARSGKDDVDYPTSTGLLDATLANYNGDVPGVHNETGHSFAVGTYAPNPFGMYDMGGNVWEWCLDYYSDSFYQDGATDPVNTTAGTDAKRIRRGGAWNYHASTLLVYARESDFQNRGNNHFGFRIVKN